MTTKTNDHQSKIVISDFNPWEDTVPTLQAQNTNLTSMIQTLIEFAYEVSQEAGWNSSDFERAVKMTTDRIDEEGQHDGN